MFRHSSSVMKFTLRSSAFVHLRTYYKNKWASKLIEVNRFNPVRGRNRELFVPGTIEFDELGYGVNNRPQFRKNQWGDGVDSSLEGIAQRTYTKSSRTSLLNPVYLKQNKQKPSVDAPVKQNELKQANQFGNYSLESATEMKMALADVNDSEENQREEEKPYLRLSQHNRAHPSFYYEDKLEKMLHRQMANEAMTYLLETVIEKDRVQPTGFMFNVVLSGLAEIGDSKNAFKLYNKMKKMGLDVQPHTYTSLFNACANNEDRQDSLERATLLLGSIREKNVPLTFINYKCAVKTFGLCGDIETAFLLADECSEKHKPDDNMFTSLLMACCSDQENGFGLAIQVWRHMRKKNLTLNSLHYNTLLRCVNYCGVGDIDKLQKIVQSNDENPQLLSYEGQEDNTKESHGDKLAAIPTHDVLNRKMMLPANFVINSMENATDRLLFLGGVAGILRRMEVHNCEADVKTFFYLLKALPGDNAAENELLRIMEDKMIKADGLFYKHLMLRRANRYDFKAMTDIVGILAKENIVPDESMFSVLALGCSDPVKGAELLDTMEAVNLKPNLPIFTSMLKNCHYSDLEFKTFLLEAMRKYDVQPNQAFLSTLKKNFISCKNQLVSQEKGRDDCEYDHEIQPENLSHYETVYTQWLGTRGDGEKSIAVSN